MRVCPDCLAELGSDVEACTWCGFTRPAVGWPPDPLSGLLLGGRYRLESRLGSGGMASVFRAGRIGALGGQVAVKILAPRFARTVIAKRFEREAQVVSRLTNPHIVRIYDFDTVTLPATSDTPATPLYYIAMELVEGPTLAELLRAQGQVNFLWAVDVLRQIARGLEEAHAQGIVHRDLKPSNLVLIRQRGATHVKILDFGIAALSQTPNDGAAPEKLTQAGLISGTPDYMAPEQAVGDPNIGPAADMFALGVIAYQLFTGQKPFAGSTMESLLARVTKPIPKLEDAITDPAFPPDLFRVVNRLLARDVRDRYPNAGALLDDLTGYPSVQTTPDFAPPAEILKRYNTTTGGALDPASRAQSTQTIIGTTVAPPHPKRWPLWIALGLVVAGAGGWIIYDQLQHAHWREHHAHEDNPPSTEPSVSTAKSDNPPAAPPASPPPEVPLEEPRVETRLRLSPAAVLVATLPSTPTSLFAPLGLTLALDEDGRRTPLTDARLSITRTRDGRLIADLTPQPLSEGRLAFLIPPRPTPEPYDLTLHRASQPDLRLRFDGQRNTLALP